jgi:sucrose-6-phosphate hydrolase SacC (GH32 family)
MIVAAGNGVELYRSSDLKTWNLASTFGAEFLPGLCWECPDLFSLPDEDGTEVWILVTSALSGDNFTGEFGACFASYFSGQFNGHTFTSDEATPRRLSYGPDDYAPVTFSAVPDERRVLIGWMSHWGYAGNMGTTPWKGQMTLPRQLSWKNGALLQSPPTEFDAAWDQYQMPVEESTPLSLSSPVWEVVVPARTHSWRLEARQNDELVFALTRDHCWRWERFAAALPPEGDAKAGWQEFFLSPVEAPVLTVGETRIVVDKCSVEVFGDGGSTLFCAQIFPQGGEWQVSIAATE